MAVNTGRLDDAGARLPVDAYIERGNYGRDFASYQAGLRLAQEIAPEAERWLLFNDSVFYVSHGLEPFLERLLRCHADICSATESVEVLPHQTSFCLSFSRACVQHPRFQKFWRRYVGMDLRPWTVFLGEIALSRVLLGTGLTRETLGGMEAVKRAFSQGVADPVGRAEGQGVGQSAPWQGEGNMTHRAPDLMLDLGLPMVKLDLPHRGGKTDSELQGLLTRLEPVESQSLDELWRLQAEKHQRSSRLDRLGARCGLA